MQSRTSICACTIRMGVEPNPWITETRSGSPSSQRATSERIVSTTSPEDRRRGRAASDATTAP